MLTLPLLARCYGNLYALFHDVFGVEGGAWEVLKVFQTFGFLMAMAFLGSAIFTYLDLKRKAKLEWVKPYQQQVEVGKPASLPDLASNAVLGFVLGFKLIGLLFDLENVTQNPQAWILSMEGSWIGGIIGAAFMAYAKYREAEKERLDKPKMVTRVTYPHDMIGDITMWAAIGGILGAKFFYLFESPGNFTDFLQDPFGSFFGGLTIYGGLIGGTIAVVGFAYKRGIHIIHLADSVTVTLFLSYAIGRMGCQVAGDGDWGIDNLNPKPDWLSWAPDWVWAYKYAHNVNNDGVPIPGCMEQYCYELPNYVYPTPLYEIIMSLLLFGFLWGIRKRITIPGVMISMYLILNAIERFLIEQIRVTPDLKLPESNVTQAEIIAVIFFFSGIASLIFFVNRYKRQQAGN